MAKYKAGITVGVFDLFHVGHLNLLVRCKAMCDKLAVMYVPRENGSRSRLVCGWWALLVSVV